MNEDVLTAGRIVFPIIGTHAYWLATKAGQYKLADAAYAKLLHKLDGHYAEMPQDLRTDILAFYLIWIIWRQHHKLLDQVSHVSFPPFAPDAPSR